MSEETGSGLEDPILKFWRTQPPEATTVPPLHYGDLIMIFESMIKRVLRDQKKEEK